MIARYTEVGPHGGPYKRFTESTPWKPSRSSPCVVAAVVYGILHDQVTARVCVEYFTIGHPPIFNTQSPTLLALGWGIIATWWVGIMLGVPTALACRAGSWPKFTARQLVWPIVILMVVMGIGALTAGIAGYYAAQSGDVQLVGGLDSRIAPEKHAAFIADLWAHITSYALGFIGGWVIVSYVVFARWHGARAALKERWLEQKQQEQQ